MNPYLFTFIAVSVIAAVACDASSAIIMFFQTFAENFLSDPTVNLGLAHRRSKLKSVRCRTSWQMELFSKAKNFALQLRFIATPFSQKSTDFCDVL